MNRSRVSSLIVLVIVAALFGFSSRVIANENSASSLHDVHEVLLQAAGDQPDNMPSGDQQTELLHKAIKMLRTVPHVYHGQLRTATRDINAALNELSTGDAGHKVRSLILDADDQIKSVM